MIKLTYLIPALGFVLILNDISDPKKLCDGKPIHSVNQLLPSLIIQVIITGLVTFTLQTILK